MCYAQAAVALRTCTVSFSGPSGIRHSVDVTAESVYEAAAWGVSALRKSGWADAVALGTELGDSSQRTAHVSPHHGAPDSSVVRWDCGQPRRDAEEAQTGSSYWANRNV